VLDFFYEFINSVYYFIYIESGHAFRLAVLPHPPALLLEGEGRDVLDFFYEFINSVYYFIYIKTGHAFRFVVFDLTPNPSPARRGEQSGIDLSFI
ncbi:MAG TPA: hypothetical protein PK605_15770, partial [Ignavibacteria bacterium]|nr:hypothetical protein [Ignavibacteria bacterium]